jgi:hypothetical protein
MNVLHLIVGGSRDNGARINGFLALMPMLPQTRKTENFLIGPGDMIGLFSPVFYRPLLIIACCRDDDMTLFKGCPK